jgi:hypothetical protein
VAVVSDPQIKTGLKTIQDVAADVSVATDVDLLNCDCTSGAITVTLPRAIKGHTISIRKTDSSANTLTIDGFQLTQSTEHQPMSYRRNTIH